MSKQLTAFRQALLDAASEQFDHVPQEQEIACDFSPEHKAWADKQLRKSRRRAGHRVGPVMKRVVIAAVLAALLATTVMASPALYRAVMEYFTRDRGTHFTFQFTQEDIAAAPDTIQQLYMPQYIPETFEILEDGCSEGRYSVTLTWANKEGRQINYYQSVITEETGYINAEVTEARKILIGDMVVFRSEREEYLHYIWTDGQYYFNLICPKEAGEETLQSIFLSICPAEAE